MKHPIPLSILTIALTIAASLSLSPLTAQTSGASQSQSQPPSQTPSQDQYIIRIAAANPPEQAIAPLRYLASDQLKGRYIGRPEIDTAALSIANMLGLAGARIVPGGTGFFQIFYRQFTRPSTTGVITIGTQSFKTGTTALQFDPADLQLNGPITYIGDDSAGALTARTPAPGVPTTGAPAPGAPAPLDLKGRLVLMTAGSGSRASGRADFRRINAIRKVLADKGALGLLVLLNADKDYWSAMQGRFTNEQLADPDQTPGQSAGHAPVLAPAAPTPGQSAAQTPGHASPTAPGRAPASPPAAQPPVIILHKPVQLPPDFAKSPDTRASINITGTQSRRITLRNVLAYVQGTDSVLKKQYIVLSSHYDHLGVAKTPQMEEGKLDSIYNGARDNATGTTAVIDAARYFARYPPKRSVLFITYTAEEEGLIGSEYYAAHPLVPLDHTVYNLNIDNASYDDTTLITLVGLNRTSEDSLIIKACRAYGLSVNGDPTGGSLFYASDNTPLAQAGVPAPTYSLGMRAMDSTIFNRYHRLSDEATNMDMHYVLKFIKAYILAAQYIANDPTQPTWTKGDEFEKASQTPYKTR